MKQQHRQSSFLRTVGQVVAVGAALSVLGCYVYDAQQRADERHQQQPAGDGATPTTLPSSKSLAIEPAEGFLPSSKSRALPVDEIPITLPSTKGMTLGPQPAEFLAGSKSGVIVDPDTKTPATTLPSSKVIVMPKEFLFSSKSAAPLPAVEQPAKSGTKVSPTRKNTKTAPKK